jgi:hypothetical protein
MTRTRTSRTTQVDLARALTMRDIAAPARNDIPGRDTTVYTWPGEPVRGRTPTLELEVMR